MDSNEEESQRQLPQTPKRTISRRVLTIIKYLILILTGMCLVLEIIQIVLGAGAGNIFDEFHIFLDNRFHSMTSFMVAIGIIMMLIVLFGSIGIVIENVKVITFYVILFSLMVVLEVVAAIIAFDMVNRVDDMLKIRMNIAFSNFHYDRNIQQSVNHMQQRLECCGFDGYQDWYTWPNSIDGTSPVPPSCYITMLSELPFQRGCFGQLSQTIEYITNLIATGTTIIIFFQVICIVSAVVLGIHLRNFQRQVIPPTSANVGVPVVHSQEPVKEEKTKF